MLVLGDVGSGKSMFLKWKTLWHVLLGGRAYVIDLEGEFEPLAHLLGAEHIDLGLGSGEGLNVLDVNPDDEEGYYTGATDLLGWLALAELDSRCRTVVHGLVTLGIGCARLDDEEILEMVTAFCHPSLPMLHIPPEQRLRSLMVGSKDITRARLFLYLKSPSGSFN